MGLFDIFKKQWPKFDSDRIPTSQQSSSDRIFASRRSGSDRILTAQGVEEMLTGDYGDTPNAVIVVCEESDKPIMPSDLVLLPFLLAEFSEDAALGMIYGTGSGCALVRKTALEEIQVLHSNGTIHISSCQDFMDALQRLEFTVKQDPKLDLDLLP